MLPKKVQFSTRAPSILFINSTTNLNRSPSKKNKTFSKTKFDVWKQLSYDTNDTVKDSLWFTDRVNRLIDVELEEVGKDPVKEETAAEKAAKHHDTPSVVFMDNLGRPVLSVSHNRNLNEEDEFYPTRILLDIEGNPIQVIDARDNTVMQ